MTVIAIDGPSGVGKSSVSKAVATQLGYAYLDTGAMYRAMGWLCMTRGITDPGDVVELVRGADLEISTDPAAPAVAVDGIEVTEEIRSTEVSASVQVVSAVPEARSELIEMQRQIIAAADPGIVVEGRDITTVVAPDAPVRILMTADDEVRVARRAKETHGTADAEAVAATRDVTLGRDAKDAQTTSFLTAADGVHTLDTTHIDFDQSVGAVLALVAAAQKA